MTATTAIAATSLTPVERLGAAELARRIAAGELTARDVTEAHIRRIEQVNPRLNAVVIPCYESARQTASAIDAARLRGERLGPLAGVPITIKEAFYVDGTQTTIGISRFVGQQTPPEGPLVRRLREAGAVILGKTNVPQLMLMHESDSPVYGRANNPWNLDRSPGGSSGGEGAIVAAGGSALGLASDIGGSIRQPAHACGVCGLKPTSGRLTLDGCLFNLRGMEAFVAQAGPIARTVDDLSLAMRVLAAPGLEAFDPQIPPVPWSDPSSVSIRGLRVAMWTDDGYFRPSPAVRRAVDLAAESLRRRGAIVEPFAPPDVHQAMRLYFHLISADGAADGMRMLGDSPKEPQVRQLIRLGRLPRHLRPLLARLMEFAGRGREADMVRSTGALTADEYWRLTHERAQYAKLFQRTLDAGRFDAMLCPPHGLPALTHGGFSAAPGAWSYCVVFNLLGVPAGVVPATIVGRREESDRTNVREASERGAMRVERHSAGLPVGVQVAGRWWREDVVLALLSAIEDDLRTRPDYPGFPPL